MSSFSAEKILIVAAAKIRCWYKVITEFETPFGKDYVSLRSISSIMLTKKIVRDRIRSRITCKLVRWQQKKRGKW